MNGEIKKGLKGGDEGRVEDGNWCEGCDASIGCKWYHDGMCVLISAQCKKYIDQNEGKMECPKA